MAEKLNRRPGTCRAWGVRAERTEFGSHSQCRRGKAAARILLMLSGVPLLLLASQSPRMSAGIELSEVPTAVSAPAAATEPFPSPRSGSWSRGYSAGCFTRPAEPQVEVPADSPPEVDPRVKEIDVIYSAVSDPNERMALAAEMASVNDPQAVVRLLSWIETEPESRQRRDLLHALAVAEGRRSAAALLVAPLQRLYASSTDAEEKFAIREVQAGFCEK